MRSKAVSVVIIDFTDNDNRDTVTRKWTEEEINGALRGVPVTDRNRVIRAVARAAVQPATVVWRDAAGTSIDAAQVRPLR
jgi:hypothetical protein